MRAVALLGMVALAWGCDAGRTTDRKEEGAPAAVASGAGSAAAAPGATSSGAPLALTAAQEKEAQQIVINDCLACHAEPMLKQQRLTSKQWAAVVKKMQGWGSQVEASNVDALVTFLSARYGTSTPAYSLPTVSAEAAASAIMPTPDGAFGGGDAAKGGTLYKEACASCHGESAQGAALGVRLADRPKLFRAEDFAGVVRKGRGRMPAFPTFKDEDIAAVLAYLRSLGPA